MRQSADRAESAATRANGCRAVFPEADTDAGPAQGPGCESAPSGIPLPNNAAVASRLVLLVPGCFGFTSVGAVSYFELVEQSLAQALRRCGVTARIIRCRTQPAASIRRRADELRRLVLRRGGLDVRMLLSPGV